MICYSPGVRGPVPRFRNAAAEVGIAAAGSQDATTGNIGITPEKQRSEAGTPDAAEELGRQPGCPFRVLDVLRNRGTEE